MLHLMIHADGLEGGALGVTFEQAAERLERLPRLHLEPDGWFAWNSAADERRWEVAGQIHDRGPRVGHVEIKLEGVVPPMELDRLLAAFGWPESRLAFQLVREGVVVDEAGFRLRVAGNA
jgi:hypothetical protein